MKDQAFWVDLQKVDHGFKFDIRYARSDNFMNEVIYPSANAFLLNHVTEDLIRVHQSLSRHGYGLLIFDAYRPWAVTKHFWDRSSDEMRQYLANPETGSSHNRGCAVDLSMFDLKTGLAVEMPSDFDEMNEKAHVAYAGGTAESRRLRDLLQSTMKENYFKGIANEWWHFNHVSHADHPVENLTFEAMLLQVQQIRPHKG